MDQQIQETALIILCVSVVSYFALALGQGLVLMQKVIVFVNHVLQLSCVVSIQMNFIIVLSCFCAASLCFSNFDRKHLISDFFFST